RPGYNERVRFTVQYVAVPRFDWYVFDGSDTKTLVDRGLRGMVARKVNQRITAILNKSQLLSLPQEYLDPTHANYKPIVLTHLNLMQNLSGLAPSTGPCAGQSGWSMLQCALEIVKAGSWLCQSGNARNLAANPGWQTDP